MVQKKRITVVSPCYNEEENIVEFYDRLKAVLNDISDYEFDIIVIDNNSTDQTFDILKKMAIFDKNLKLIQNIRNFGHIRSPYYALLQTSADAVILMASDLQEPPELIPNFIRQWENGNKVVFAVRTKTEKFSILNELKTVYYKILNRISNVSMIRNATGFGLYDKQVIDEVRKISDPSPYLRGLISELGFSIQAVEFVQPLRKKGVTKNNFYSLYDYAMLAFVSHSKVPIRLATLFGFLIGLLSLVLSVVFLILKLVFWDKFSAGTAPLLIMIFFLFGILLVFIGILGEYVASIHTYAQKRPIVIEKERINFEK